jgi:hypothetical protein
VRWSLQADSFVRALPILSTFAPLAPSHEPGRGWRRFNAAQPVGRKPPGCLESRRDYQSLGCLLIATHHPATRRPTCVGTLGRAAPM